MNNIWTQQLPKEQGDYWWWDGDEDGSPIHLSILYSGTTDSCFAPMGQYGWTRHWDVEEMVGWWSKLEWPSLPDVHLVKDIKEKILEFLNSDASKKRVASRRVWFNIAFGIGRPQDEMVKFCIDELMVEKKIHRPSCGKGHAYKINNNG